MVLRTDLDDCDGTIQAADTEAICDFFCYRCNMTKRSRHRAFWYTPAGPKVLCRPCSEEIQRKSERRAKRKAKPLGASSDTRVVHPPLLELLADKQRYFQTLHFTPNNIASSSSSTAAATTTSSSAASSTTLLTVVTHDDSTAVAGENDNEDKWPIEFYGRFLALIVRGDLRPGVGEHFFKVFTSVAKSLGSERLILTSPTLVERDDKDGGNAANFHADDEVVDVKRLTELIDAMTASVAKRALSAEAVASIDKLSKRLSFVVDRQRNATLWLQTLTDAMMSSASDDKREVNSLLLALDVQQHKQLRALLFYRRCRFTVALLTTLVTRVERQIDGSNATNGDEKNNTNSTTKKAPSKNNTTSELRQEFWATLSALRICVNTASSTDAGNDDADNDGGDDVRRRFVTPEIAALATRLYTSILTSLSLFGLERKHSNLLKQWLGQRKKRTSDDDNDDTDRKKIKL